MRFLRDDVPKCCALALLLSVSAGFSVAWADKWSNPRHWAAMFERHATYAAPLRQPGFDPIRIAYGAERSCKEPEGDSASCRDLERLPSAVETARQWWPKNRAGDAEFLNHAPTDSLRTTAGMFRDLEAAIEEMALSVPIDGAVDRQAEDIWRHSILVLAHERLLLDAQLERNGYWSDGGESLAEAGESFRFGSTIVKAAAYSAISRRLAYLCLVIDPSRQDHLCLSLLRFDDSYAAAAERYGENASEELQRVTAFWAYLDTEIENNPDWFGPYGLEILKGYREGVAPLSRILAADSELLKDLAALPENTDAEAAAELERRFGAPTKYRWAANGNDVR
ncbi:hypothetical protein [Pacificispira sp.]|uniref:hypothetical protein n=1 Tax=Pacificispira sp. TaxID=2888761 RepID=UPI003B52F598